jgi:hypothetical protein
MITGRPDGLRGALVGALSSCRSGSPSPGRRPRVALRLREGAKLVPLRGRPREDAGSCGKLVILKLFIQ